MPSSVVQEQRIRALNEHTLRQSGDHVLYWMQQSQRAEDNHALEYAVQQANDLQQPLLVVFGLMDDYPEANLRHYAFMLEGLQETRKSLYNRGIRLVVHHGAPDQVALKHGKKASLIVCDRGYLRHQKAWRRELARQADCRVVQVETDVVVPVDEVSNKVEYAARTIRPKIHKQLDRYLVGLRTTAVDHDSLKLGGDDGLDLSDVPSLLDKLKLDRSIAPVSEHFTGGTRQAKTIFSRFVDNLKDYDNNRNKPETGHVSHMSKYLHFGQISPLYLALAIQEASPAEDRDTYLEELIVRRELPMNFVNFHDQYDSYNALPDWAQTTLAEHRDDERDYHYTRQQLEDAQTHDRYWNAAMREMKHTGYMHNYMRMYWGKKILEWSNTPEYAYQTTLYLNNKYFLDGRDANSYANVAWVFGLHDRPWKERPVYGKVRYLSADGLKRKADIESYVDRIDRLTADQN